LERGRGLFRVAGERESGREGGESFKGRRVRVRG